MSRGTFQGNCGLWRGLPPSVTIPGTAEPESPATKHADNFTPFPDRWENQAAVEQTWLERCAPGDTEVFYCHSDRDVGPQARWHGPGRRPNVGAIPGPQE